MSGVIWKYELALTLMQHIEIPRAAHFVRFDFQRGVPTLWLYVDAPEPTHSVAFHIFGTGMKTLGLDFGNYLATAGSEEFIWHLFSGTNLK
jgi:hypothetical protein